MAGGMLSHPMIACLADEERRALELAQVELVEDGEVAAAGEVLDHVYFITGGSARAVMRDAATGIRMVFDTLNPGDVIGLGIGEGQNVSPCGVIANEGFAALVAPLDAVLRLLGRSKTFAMAVLRHVEAKRKLLQDRLTTGRDLDVARVVFDARLLQRFPPQYLLSKKLLPLSFQSGLVTLATAAPDTSGIEAEMQRILNAQRVMLYRIPSKVFERIYIDAVQKRAGAGAPEDPFTWYRGVRGKDYALQFETAADVKAEAEGARSELDGAAVVSQLNKLIGEAMELGVSDIHMEPFTGGMEIRYRIDGELLARPDRVSGPMAAALVSRAKVLAGMDISERRKPQDGRLSVTLGRRTVDMRVSSVPTRFGEKMVMRLLDPSTMLIELDQLVLSKEVRDSVRAMLEQPCGVILVAGPTGSGKTTTVYSLLMAKKAEPVNVVTIEDPIEYVLRGITQVQRNPHVDLDFHNAVRSFLRQDPDVIIVGETRDSETAKAVLEAGLTGHLVISTIHASNVFATAYRLREMGAEPFVIANSLIGVLSQRLVRRVCAHCAQSVQYHRQLIDPMELPGLPPCSGDHYLFQRGKGCVHCNFRGYRGRAAVYEVLSVPDELKPVIASDVPFTEIQKAAEAQRAYVSLRSYASMLLNLGITTPEEVSRILFVENR